jgi:hypothetical protein
MAEKPSSFKFDKETKEMLAQISKKYDRNMTWVLRRLVKRQHQVEFGSIKPSDQSTDLNDQGSQE